VVVISDGEDKDSYYDYAALLKRIKQSDVQLYFIGLQKGKSESLFDLSGTSREVARQGMYELTSLTGGRVFIPADLDELGKIASTLAADLRNQYRIGYHPSEVQRQPTFRRIQVVLKKTTPYGCTPARDTSSLSRGFKLRRGGAGCVSAPESPCEIRT